MEPRPGRVLVAATEREAVARAPASRYVIVWALLMVLTILTFVASRLPLGHFHVPVALTIALAKGALIVLFFMHLWDHGGANRLVVLVAMAFVALLTGVTVLDLADRFPLAMPSDPSPPGFHPTADRTPTSIVPPAR